MTQNNETRPLELSELAQRAALSPTILDVRSPDGIDAKIALVPAVESGGRATVRLESLAKFFDEYRPSPQRRIGTANLADLPSLIGHINRFKDADSVIFADTDRSHPSITAVLDYHRQGSSGVPRFGTHRSKYAFPVSEEWTAWTKVSGNPMSQTEFAEFVETHIVDVVEHKAGSGGSADVFAQQTGLAFATPAQVMELSRGLEVNVDSKFATSTNLQNGVKQIQFAETHTGENGAPLKVPGAFLIGIPVFRAEARYRVCVRLRYRKQGPSLCWIMELWRHDEVFDAAIRDACDKVKAATELPLMVGTPE